MCESAVEPESGGVGAVADVETKLLTPLLERALRCQRSAVKNELGRLHAVDIQMSQ